MFAAAPMRVGVGSIVNVAWTAQLFPLCAVRLTPPALPLPPPPLPVASEDSDDESDEEGTHEGTAPLSKKSKS